MSRAQPRPLVLLAEDSEDDAFFFRWSLEKCGVECDVVHALDGAEAVKLLQAGLDAAGRRTSRCPDLIFLDLKMPAQSGFDVLTWIREHPFNPPIQTIVLSGSEHGRDVERARDLGATEYCVKPISPDLLRRQIDGWQIEPGSVRSDDRAAAYDGAANPP